MKFSTLCLLASVVLCSCGDEVSDDSNAENIFKKRRKTGDIHFPGDNNNGNGNTGAYQTQQVPFDLGLSAVMGAGAIAAVRKARQKRKEETR